MEYDWKLKTAHTSRPTTLLKREPREQTRDEQYFTLSDFLYDKTGEEVKHRPTSSDVISFDIIMCAASNLRTPWKKHSIETTFFDNLKINIKSEFFSNVNRYIKGFPIEDTQLLSKTDKALESLSKAVTALSEGLFCNIRLIPPSRAPGFVIDGWIVIPEYDRNVEYKIYKELGNTLRKNPNLLFNIRVIARKGRDLSKVVPEGYKKYRSWFEYIC